MPKLNSAYEFKMVKGLYKSNTAEKKLKKTPFRDQQSVTHVDTPYFLIASDFSL